MLQLPELYTNHIKKYLNYPQYLSLLILLTLIQDCRCVRLEELANRFPYPIQLRSRIKKLQRFLSLPQFNPKTLWLPILERWLNSSGNLREKLYIVIDRSQWKGINLLMVSLVDDRRAIPLHFSLLPKKGNSNLAQQKQVLEPVFELLKNYQIVVLGDREFCGVDLAKWLKEEQKVNFCLRLKKNEYAELAPHIWFQLSDLGVTPGISLYFPGIKMTQTKGFGDFKKAAKWKRNYQGKSAKEPWFILTTLPSLSSATSAYAQRMDIEEMFQDFKKGGYNLEGTQVTGDRLISLILLICFAYCWATFSGQSIQHKSVAKYVSRPTEPNRSYRRHSSFYMGLHGLNWLDSLSFFSDEIAQLMAFSPHQRSHYQKGLRAASLIQSVF